MTDLASGYNSAAATYVGGPLAGQTVTRLGARHPIYRSDDGKPLSPSQGEWISWSPCGETMHLRVRHYVHREVIEGHTICHFYVHASVIAQWQNERSAKTRGSFDG